MKGATIINPFYIKDSFLQLSNLGLPKLGLLKFNVHIVFAKIIFCKWGIILYMKINIIRLSCLEVILTILRSFWGPFWGNFDVIVKMCLVGYKTIARVPRPLFKENWYILRSFGGQSGHFEVI